MNLSDVIKVWDIVHVKNTGELGYCDLEAAIDEIVGVTNDIVPCGSKGPPLISGMGG